MHFHCSLRGSTACPQQSFVHRWITNGWMIWIDVNGISRFDLQSKILILSGLTVGALALWQRRRSRSISPETVETQDISPPLSSHFAVMHEILKSRHPIRCLPLNHIVIHYVREPLPLCRHALLRLFPVSNLEFVLEGDCGQDWSCRFWNNEGPLLSGNKVDRPSTSKQRPIVYIYIYIPVYNMILYLLSIHLSSYILCMWHWQNQWKHSNTSILQVVS